MTGNIWHADSVAVSEEGRSMLLSSQEKCHISGAPKEFIESCSMKGKILSERMFPKMDKRLSPSRSDKKKKKKKCGKDV